MNGPDAVIAHHEFKLSALFRQVVQKFLLNDESYAFFLKTAISTIVKRFANPTDWAINPSSSAGHGGGREDAHNISPVLDKTDIGIGQFKFCLSFHGSLLGGFSQPSQYFFLFGNFAHGFDLAVDHHGRGAENAVLSDFLNVRHLFNVGRDIGFGNRIADHFLGLLAACATRTQNFNFHNFSPF
jgi:hypothetical protein